MNLSVSQSPTARILLPILIFLAILLAAFHQPLLATVTFPFPHCSAAQTHLPPSPNVKIFREVPVLLDMSPAGDAAWADATLTPRGGFLWLRHNGTAHGWGISMFHALHCLQTIRAVVRESPVMRGGSPGGRTQGEGMAHHHGGRGESGHDMMDPAHVAHCIGYIAQHLLCAADGTIEPPWIRQDNEGNPVRGVDGEGYEHQCRDNSLLRDVAMDSEQKAFPSWNWQQGDTIESVFRKRNEMTQ